MYFGIYRTGNVKEKFHFRFSREQKPRRAAQAGVAICTWIDFPPSHFFVHEHVIYHIYSKWLKKNTFGVKFNSFLLCNHKLFKRSSCVTS